MSLQTSTTRGEPAWTAGRDPSRPGAIKGGSRLSPGWVVVAVASLTAAIAVRALTGLGLAQTALVAATLVAGVWWVLSPRRMSGALNRWSVIVGLLATVEVVVLGGPTWQQSGWEAVAALTAGSALWRMGRTAPSSRTSRWARAAHRSVLVTALLGSAFLAQFELAPALPAPTGRFHVGSEVFSWTDPTRPETLTANRLDLREVVAQAWYPTDTATGRPTRYIGAGSDTALAPGLPPGFFRRYDAQADTHAHDGVPVSRARTRWPVLLFSPGLGVARQSYTALCTELASRGYVVVAMGHPYESPVTRLADGSRAAPRTFLPTTASGLAAIVRLVDIRAADSSFVLSRLEQLTTSDPGSPLAGHLDLAHAGILGHSLGGATAVRTMANDGRFLAGVNLDGRLFGTVPALRQPFLWVQSAGTTADTSEHAATHRTRDLLIDRLAAGGALVTVAGSSHLSFSDAPAYLTPLGRHLVGRLPAAGIGTAPVAELARITADLVTSVMGPALNGSDSGSLAAVAARDPAVAVVHVVPPTASTAAVRAAAAPAEG